MQREAGGDAVGAGALSGEFRQDALAGVLDHRKIVALGDLHQLDHVGDLAGQLHRHDRLGPRRDRGLDLVDIHAEGIVAIDQHRRRAGFGDRADGGDEGVGGGDDLVAVADAERLQRQLERIGAGADADRVTGADQLGEALLEFGNRLAQREIAGRDQPADFGQDRRGVGELLEQIGISNVVAWSCRSRGMKLRGGRAGSGDGALDRSRDGVRRKPVLFQEAVLRAVIVHEAVGQRKPQHRRQAMAEPVDQAFGDRAAEAARWARAPPTSPPALMPRIACSSVSISSGLTVCMCRMPARCPAPPADRRRRAPAAA